MLQPPQLRPVATLAAGTAVFGGAVAVLAYAKPVDPRAALAGLLAAAALTVALLTMIWARRRTICGRTGPSIRPEVPPATPADRVTVIDLGQGQSAVIFAEPTPGPTPLEPGPGIGALSAREAAATADAICAAVAAAVEAAGQGQAPGPGTGPAVGSSPPGGPGRWSRLQSRLRSRRPARGGPGPDSR